MPTVSKRFQVGLAISLVCLVTWIYGLDNHTVPSVPAFYDKPENIDPPVTTDVTVATEEALTNVKTDSSDEGTDQTGPVEWDDTSEAKANVSSESQVSGEQNVSSESVTTGNVASSDDNVSVGGEVSATRNDSSEQKVPSEHSVTSKTKAATNTKKVSSDKNVSGFKNISSKYSQGQQSSNSDQRVASGNAASSAQNVSTDQNANNEPYRVSSEQRLMTRLLWKYENSVRPIYNSSNPVNVALGLTLTQILDLDEKNQVLTTNVWMEVEWYDEKLTWKKEDYENTESIRIPCRKLWLPDVVLYNSVDDYTSGYMPSLAMVYTDGRVFWGPVVRFRSSCKIDITYFPFDDQLCWLKLGSWAYNGFQVNVSNRSDTIDLSNFVDNGEWELIGVKVTRNSVIYNCCKEPFPDVKFYIRLRRRVKYYFMNIIIPCIILSFLCLAGFMLPPESGEKITLGLSVLLTITVFMLMVADKMPQTSESISVISIYLMVVLSMSCMSILFSVGILSIHHQRGKPRDVPKFVKVMAFSIFAPLMCLKLKSSSRSMRRNCNSVRGKKSSIPHMSFPEVIPLDVRGGNLDMLDEMDNFLMDDLLQKDSEIQDFRSNQEAVNELIHWLHIKHKDELKEDFSFQEWRDVAFVADRLLFIVFLIVNMISTFVILGMRPENTEL